MTSRFLENIPTLIFSILPILILIVLSVLLSLGFYWYFKKKKECQNSYNIQFDIIQNDFKRNFISNDFEEMGRSILKADSLSWDLRKKYPSFIVKRIITREDLILSMYTQLHQNLYRECDKAIANNEHYAKVLAYVYKMQDSVKYVSCQKDMRFAEETRMNDQQSLNFYIKVQSNLQDSFAQLLSKKTATEIESICELLQNMQKAKTLVLVKPENGMLQQFKNDDNRILSDFDEVQSKLVNEFFNIGKEFLEKTTYESVINSVVGVIRKSEKFIKSFSEYQLKPKDNSNQITYMKNIAERFGELYQKVLDSNICYAIKDDEYGQCDKSLINLALSQDTQSVTAAVESYYSIFATGDFGKILSIDLKSLATYVWHFAMHKPFSTQAFEKISKLYNGFYKNIYTAEILLAELYYIKQMGGDTVIRNRINYLLDEKNGKIREMIKYNVVLNKVGNNRFDLKRAIQNHTKCTNEDAENIINGHTSIVKEGIDYNLANSIMYEINRSGSLASIEYHHNSSFKLLSKIASGLMWIGAYDSEKNVLEYMLSQKLPMTEKQQERLHSLNNGGGDAPKVHTVTTDESILYFDISSISWRDNEYKGFFENLAFEERILQYSVAVRDEDKELIVSRRVKFPDQTILFNKIKSVFYEEYGDATIVKNCRCCALSGNSKENIDGILVQSKECKQLGVLVHMACIGKKVTIKFFSLYMPEVKDLAAQKQQLLSLYKKMSPSVTMWENSLKDSILIAFQQLMNELPSADTIVTGGVDVEF